MTTIAPDSATLELVSIPLHLIHPDPSQARDEGADDELAESIATHGILKPIEVRDLPDVPGEFMIVDGERRWRGAQKAGLEEIPALVRDAVDVQREGDRLLRQVIHNDGKRLKPLEEARTFKRIMADKGWELVELAKQLGRAKSTIADRLAILGVPAEFVSNFEYGILGAAAAPILRPLSDLPERARKRVVEQILEDYAWDDVVFEARDNKKPVPLDVVKNVVAHALQTELAVIDPKLETGYQGKRVQIGKTEYAIDVKAYESAKSKAIAAGVKPKRPQLSDDEKKERAKEAKRKADDKAARERSERARAKKKLMHRAQLLEVLSSIPAPIDAKLALVLVQALVYGETSPLYGDNDEILGALGIDAKVPKGYHGFQRAIIAHAEKLDLKGRLQLAVKIAIYSDDPALNKEEDFLGQAAAALKIDLKKVKLPEELADDLAAPAKSKGKKR